jgi:hypothetical protein
MIIMMTRPGIRRVQESPGERNSDSGRRSVLPGPTKSTLTKDSVCVFITAVPIIKLFAWGEGE